MMAALGNTLDRLEAEGDRYLAVIFVVNAGALAKLKAGEPIADPAFSQVVQTLRFINDGISGQARGEIGVAEPIRKRLWITVAVRGASQAAEGPMAPWMEAALQALNEEIPGSAPIVTGIQSLATTAYADGAHTADLPHFQMLRVLVDVMRQSPKAVQGETHVYTEMWNRLRREEAVHQIDLNRQFSGVWSDSELFAHILHTWYEGQKQSGGKSLADKVAKLKDGLDNLKQNANSAPTETNQDPQEVREKIKDRLTDHKDGFDPEQMEIESGMLPNGTLRWPKLGTFMRFRKSRVEWLEDLRKIFLDNLEKYHEASREVQPELLAKMREDHQTDRDGIAAQLDLLDVGAEETVLAELEAEANKIHKYRKDTLTVRANDVRSKMAEALKARIGDDSGLGQTSEEVALEQLPSYVPFQEAYAETRKALIRLTSIQLCAFAFVLSLLPVAGVAFLGEGATVLNPDSLNYAQLYFAALIIVLLVVIAVVTRLLSLQARDRFEELKLRAIDLVKDVKDLPNEVYRYARLTATNASFRLIERSLRQRSEYKAGTILSAGFASFNKPKVPSETIKAHERYTGLKGDFDALHKPVGFEAPAKFLAQNPFIESKHQLNLVFDDGVGQQEFLLKSSGIHSQDVTIKRLNP